MLGDDAKGVARKALIVTTLSTGSLIPKLRQVIVNQVVDAEGRGINLKESVARCLEQISIARVFDIEGVGEVLREIEVAAATAGITEPIEESDAHPHDTQRPAEEAELPESQEPKRRQEKKTEILDSEDEDEEEGGKDMSSSPLSSLGETPSPPSSPAAESSTIPPRTTLAPSATAVAAPTAPFPSPSSPPPAPQPPGKPADKELNSCTSNEEAAAAASPSSAIPDIILITHMSSMLHALFTVRDKSAAHDRMQVLSTQMRRITRGDYGDRVARPLIILLNSANRHSTTTTSQFAASERGGVGGADRSPFGPNALREQQQQTAQAEPTLRSIFSPRVHVTNRGSSAAATSGGQGIVKPSFGLVFAKLLDLHILCSRVPLRSKVPGPCGGGGSIRYTQQQQQQQQQTAWVAEVLLDEVGVYSENSDDRNSNAADEEKGTMDATAAAGGDGGQQRRPRGIIWQRRNREQRWCPLEVDEIGSKLS